MSFLVNIQKYWAVILFCGTIIAQWVRSEMKVTDAHERIDANEDAIKELCDKIEAVEKSYDGFRETVGIALAKIDTNIEFIKDGIKEIKNK